MTSITFQINQLQAKLNNQVEKNQLQNALIVSLTKQIGLEKKMRWENWIEFRINNTFHCVVNIEIWTMCNGIHWNQIRQRIDRTLRICLDIAMLYWMEHIQLEVLVHLLHYQATSSSVIIRTSQVFGVFRENLPIQRVTLQSRHIQFIRKQLRHLEKIPILVHQCHQRRKFAWNGQHQLLRWTYPHRPKVVTIQRFERRI